VSSALQVRQRVAVDKLRSDQKQVRLGLDAFATMQAGFVWMSHDFESMLPSEGLRGTMGGVEHGDWA